ncbi:MAG: M1 family aminopeptidase [Terriglobia bacterium]|nr:M1 family aminopeptidase [Terriglobia bacterium]
MNSRLYVSGFFLLLFAVGSALGQQAVPPTHNKPSSSGGQVIFSRGEDSPNSAENATGNPYTQQPVSSPNAPQSAALVSDAERTALTYSSYNFEVHLEPTQLSIAVQARLKANNSSDKSLDRIALQLSSSLHWYSIQVDGRPVKFQTETVESDIDHTGALTEAVVTLATPLAPGAAIEMNVIYSGTMPQSGQRLLRLGAPANIAASSEWDSVGTDFTALRGFGNAIWFPVSTAPVLLGQGSEMFDSVGKWKLRQSDAHVAMHVLVEYLDVKPSVAILNGCVVQPDGALHEQPAPSRVSPSPAKAPAPSRQSAMAQRPASAAPPETMAGNSVLQVASFTLPSTRLGFSPLSLFVIHAGHRDIPGLDIYSRVGNEAAAATYQNVFQQTRPLVEQWLGPRPRRPVVLVDLPDADDLPFEERNILFLPLKTGAANDSVGPVMAHMLGHSYFQSSRVWLNEGVAQFMTLLWIEQRAGFATTMAQMDSRRAALAIAETSDPGVDPGQSLIEPWSDIYYRDKAANVIWMLRNIVGDEALAKVLQAYVPANDHEPSYFQELLQKVSRKDLEWFFDDWVYRDRGLPDLHVVSAYSRPILSRNGTSKNYLVSVDVQNNSFCSAQVPITVESASSTQTRELLVPSHSSASMRVLIDGKPSQAVVNDGSVPEVQTSSHEQAVLPAQ